MCNDNAFFYGSISAHSVIETDEKEDGSSRFLRVINMGGYRLVLQGQCTGACADDLGILLNGTIFNIRDLAVRLGTDIPDAPELLLRAYRRWSAGFPRYLEGEFAFALWDQASARVLLGRGPGGKFPLFYAQRGEDFFFAGGLRDLLAGMGATPRINENYLARWLALTSVGSDHTFYDNVYRMIPGSVLLFEQGRITRDMYWQPEKTPLLRLRDSGEYAEGLLASLRQAVRDCLPDHSAVGSQLSGGLDSSTVTSLAAEILHGKSRRLHAFTAVPAHAVENVPGRFCDEGPAAASVAAMWPNVDHVFVRHGRHSVFKLMDLFGSEQLEPILNPANYDWIYEISLQARQRQLDTLLVGASGNSSISYDGRLALHYLAAEGHFQAMARLALEMSRYGRRRWRGIAFEAFGPWIPRGVRSLIARARRQFKGLFGYSLIRPEFARRHGLDAMAFERNTGYHDSRQLRVQFLRRPERGAANVALRRLTGVSMFDPTGDRRVVEFCLSVPVEYFCEKGVPRSLIRNAMAGRLPEQVRTERRRGLQAADFAIHFEREREEALAELARMKKVDLAVQALDLDELERMMQWSGAQIVAHGEKTNYWPKLLRAFSLGRFLRRFEDGTLFSQQQAPLNAPGP